MQLHSIFYGKVILLMRKLGERGETESFILQRCQIARLVDDPFAVAGVEAECLAVIVLQS
ncbi:hypothetical protein [Mesorhizobium sp. Cs1321R2N1]|uniref:hypothetical protein n=1 Tax=Mesorhizobium sp. Cs1321R2N1 TaxID=3015174 RepID=UPI00301DFD9C